MSELREPERDPPDEGLGAEEAREPETTPGLAEDTIRAVRDALEDGDEARALEVIEQLHVADQADLLEQLHQEEREALVEALRPRLEPELLTYLPEAIQQEVIEQLGHKAAAAAIAELEIDDAIEVLDDLDQEQQIALLESMPEPERAAVEQGLTYPEDSAGRLMLRELIAIPEFWTVGQTIDYLRAKPNLPDEFYDLYIVNPRFEPVGSIPLSRVLRSKRGVLLTELKMKELHLIPVDMDQEEVGFRFRQYGLVSAPVVDANNRLLGQITVDDVVDVIHEEAEEDILRLGGVQETDIFDPPVRTGMKRFPWLLINLGTAVVASIVIAQFEDAIERLVALAVLMPIVASMGGNGGTQTVTIVVRGLATREITFANAARVLRKEFVVGGFNGLMFLLVGILVTIVWFGDPLLGVIFGVALLITLIFAALAGVAIPMLIERFGLDPAVSSSVFLTTVTDVVGFFTFLGLATLYLL